MTNSLKRQASGKISKITIRKATPRDSRAFTKLVVALANFERLSPPTESAKRRLLRDTFKTKRLNLLLAFSDNMAAGYALYFFTYSSFLARPTLYLEDIFVLESHRGLGIGSKLFDSLVKEAYRFGCGRMEWAVLTWNTNAIKFYEKLGAKRQREWYYYRLGGKDLHRLAK
jgi:GNAT superfamily N-acetyltransferase